MKTLAAKILRHAGIMAIAISCLVSPASGLVGQTIHSHKGSHDTQDDTVDRLMSKGQFKYQTTNTILSPQDALAGEWTDNTVTKYSDPKTKSHYWFDFSFTNNDESTNEMVVFHRSTFTSEEMVYYIVDGDKIERIGFTGSNYPRNARTLRARYLGARVHAEPGSTTRFLVHVRTSRNFYPDFGFSTYEHFGQSIQESNFLMGICLGVHLIAIIISCIFAYALRDRAYAWFSALSFAMILSLVTGFGFRDILMQKLFEFDSAKLITLLRPTVLFLFLQMTSAFLTLRINAPRIHQWIQATMISSITLAILAMQPAIGKYAIDAGDRLVFVGMLLAVIAAVNCYRRNVPLSGYFLMATSTLILSTLPLMITTITSRNFSNFEMNLLPVGQSVEMLILSMALIAKVRRIDEARAGAETEASKSEELKTMVRVMSHDLNNPLTVVISYARIGLKKAQAAALEDFSGIFGKILKASLNQVEIIEHIKLMRAIEDGKATLQLTEVSLLEALRQAESTFERKLSEKNLTLHYDPAELAKCNVLAEPTSLNHNVLNNLLSNAIKFSHTGSVIEVTTESAGHHVKLVVKDHGIGMPPELVKKVFRTDAPTSRTGTNGETGTGFGMPVVKTYMDRFGGNIHIESVTEKESPQSHGTKVTLEFKKAA